MMKCDKGCKKEKEKLAKESLIESNFPNISHIFGALHHTTTDLSERKPHTEPQCF